MDRNTLNHQIIKQIQAFLLDGLCGTSQDFLSWLNMHAALNRLPFLNCSAEEINLLLEGLKSSGEAINGDFDPREFKVSDKLISGLKVDKESFVLLGSYRYSPIQFVRSRLDFFLKINSATEEECMDISIATIEAVENAVKYGDGKVIEVFLEINNSRNFKIDMINKIKEFELSNDIDRGKFSSNITLMRGVMVMQKLFDKLELNIIDEEGQAHLRGEKKLS
jgi:anti-sigma regulatory factor (Ser/Thr protein kinase)